MRGLGVPFEASSHQKVLCKHYVAIKVSLPLFTISFIQLQFTSPGHGTVEKKVQIKLTIMICKTSYILLLLKILIFICLASVFYIFYCTEVVNKFTERDTNLILSQENIEENKMKFPFITFCMTPRSKNLILDGYKLSRAVLNEPNSKDQKTLISLNKTVDALFREATFKLNRDFYLYINLWFYEDEFGWQNYEGKMKEGSDNYIQV